MNSNRCCGRSKPRMQGRCCCPGSQLDVGCCTAWKSTRTVNCRVSCSRALSTVAYATQLSEVQQPIQPQSDDDRRASHASASTSNSDSIWQTADSGQANLRIRLLESKSPPRSWPFVRVSVNDDVGSAAGFVAKSLARKGRVMIACRGDGPSSFQALRVLRCARGMLIDADGHMPAWQPSLMPGTSSSQASAQLLAQQQQRHQGEGQQQGQQQQQQVTQRSIEARGPGRPAHTDVSDTSTTAEAPSPPAVHRQLPVLVFHTSKILAGPVRPRVAIRVSAVSNYRRLAARISSILLPLATEQPAAAAVPAGPQQVASSQVSGTDHRQASGPRDSAQAGDVSQTAPQQRQQQQQQQQQGRASGHLPPGAGSVPIIALDSFGRVATVCALKAIIGARLQLRRHTHQQWDLWVVTEAQAHELIDGEEEGSTVLNRLLVMAAPVAGYAQPGTQEAGLPSGSHNTRSLLPDTRSLFQSAADVLGVTHGRITMRPGPPPPGAAQKAGRAATRTGQAGKSDRSASSRAQGVPRRAAVSSSVSNTARGKREAPR